MAAQQQAASVLQSLPFRAALLALCVAVLPLLPTAPEAGANGGPGQAFLAKACELLHLLFVGIAVSYGLFSRKNNAADDGRAGVAADAEKDAAAAGNQTAVKADARYAWRMFRDSIAPFDDDEEELLLPDSPPGGGGREKLRSWSSLHRPEDPVVVVSNGGGRTGHATDAQATLSLPVRALRSQPAAAAQDANPGGGETPRSRSRRGSATGEETVLPSPIPWRSRSGRRLDAEAGRSESPSPSPSPRRLSPASSLARETLAKASEEEYYAPKRRSGPYRSSSSVLSPPPAPPPPPPPFLVHGYHPHPAAERRTAVAKSFKEELQDHSMRGGRGEHRYSPNTSIFSNSAYSSSSSNSSTAKPRNSFDGGGGGGGSSSTTSVGKSVRTIRARAEPAAFQEQSQELPEDDAGDGRDAMRVHGLEESYSYDSYRAYQSIPRFQYERSVSDPILGGVAVSSDDTESSDDDDDEGGAYSTRTTNSPRESTPEVDENEVDKKAEEFIARFREQIRRQRIESIKKSAEPRGVKHHGSK
ncbi:hypothetical protein HU200_041901 [Digitaria exilis]|uniref:Uncharacterized protein n=1 Tax=Digitaria exilis TaxID=1010633 RepID=A0A835B617_9POAL|nr:hypothetical protein HU200_041901 [Digitaria exilis]